MTTTSSAPGASRRDTEPHAGRPPAGGPGASLADELDPAIRPQDDLFGHVNGRWLAATDIPEDRATHGVAELLRDGAESDVRAIVEEASQGEAPEGSDERKIGDLYASFVDTDAVAAAGTAPLGPPLARVAATTSAAELLALAGELGREGVPGLLEAYVWVDRGDPARYLLHLAQGGLGLPDESYYSDEEHEGTREAYHAHIARMLRLAGVATTDEAAADAAARVVALETRLAAAHWDRAACRDAVATYNVLDHAALEAALPGLGAWLAALGVPEPSLGEVVVAQPDVLPAFAAALAELPLADWQAWLSWHTVRAAAPYLTDDLVAESFAFYGTALTGAPEIRPRWKRGVALVERALGEAVGRLYVERHYPEAAQRRMAALVANLIEAYRQRITALDWLGPETRQRALDKLDRFTPKIGRPVRWRDYSAVRIERGDLLGNVRRAAAAETDRELAKLAGPVDRDEWFMTPQTVNAYYNPSMNEVVFPAAILQPPFFDVDADDAYNYGAIGSVIGHEIGHGFDDQGSRFDGDGLLADWWTPEDRQRFEERAAALVAQYDAFEPRDLPGHTVNGALTVGENIGDLGGVTVAYHAWRLSLAGEEPPVVDGLSGDERFFAGWCRSWRSKVREAEAVRRLTIDPHSPPDLRAHVVRNVDEFHATYGTQPGDGLWLDPAQRVRIW